MTQSRIRQNALIQNEVVEQAIKIMGDIIEDMDIEIELKDNKKNLENKVGLADCKVIEEMKRLG